MLDVRVNRLASYFAGIALGLLLSAGAFHYLSLQVRKEAQSKFEDECAAIEQVIALRLASYANLLMGLSGFMRHSENVTRAEFREYVAGLNLPHYRASCKSP